MKIKISQLRRLIRETIYSSTQKMYTEDEARKAATGFGSLYPNKSAVFDVTVEVDQFGRTGKTPLIVGALEEDFDPNVDEERSFIYKIFAPAAWAGGVRGRVASPRPATWSEMSVNDLSPAAQTTLERMASELID